MCRRDQDTICIGIIDTDGSKIYSGKADLNDNKSLINLLVILLKYGVNLEEIGRVINKNRALD